MKKVILSLAGVLAATAFAPEASAVPSFARQTGTACNACHWQSYPALNSFGRAFKSSGYTMMGAQGKVEGEHGLSIPNVLNASIYSQLRYVKTNGPSMLSGLAGANAKNDGRFDIPDEFALFFGGRVSENIGFLLEVPLVGLSGGSGASMIGNFKMPFQYDAGSVRLGAIPFTSAGIGASAGFDLFATGGNGAGRITENGVGYSAAMYLGTTNTGNNAANGTGLSGGPADATGVALVAVNENFHVNITPYHGESVAGKATKFGGTYVRAGWTPNFNGWDVGVGIQNWSGQPLKGDGTIAAAARDNDAKATVIDAQAQGEVSGMPLGIYASWGKAPKSNLAPGPTGSGTNIYNLSTTNDITAFGVMGDLWVIPGSMDVQLGFMRAKTGLLNANTLTQETDNSWTLGARYKVRQNVKLGFAYTKFSGTAYDIGGSGGVNTTEAGAGGAAGGGATGVAGVKAAGKGDSRTTLILSAGF